VLKRVLLIYDACRIHLINKELFPIEAITNGREYHKNFWLKTTMKKQEENYLFSAFKKSQPVNRFG